MWSSDIRYRGRQIGGPCHFIISLISLHRWLFNETTVVYYIPPINVLVCSGDDELAGLVAGVPHTSELVSQWRAGRVMMVMMSN